MEISQQSLIQVFSQSALHVPEYQRGYAWDLQNVEDFYLDLVRYIKDSEKDSSPYLFGQIIIHEEKKVIIVDEEKKEEVKRYIVDGQQRLSTVTIFVCALRDIIDQYSKQYKEDIPKSLTQTIDSIIGVYDRFSSSLKLVMNVENREFFFKYVQLNNHECLPNSESDKNIKIAYDFIFQAIERYLADKKDVLDACNTMLNRLTQGFTVAYVKEDTLAKAFVIFETLNYRGKPLAVSDLLKNYYYSMLDEAHEYLKQQWIDMIQETDGCSKGSSAQYIRYYWNSYNSMTREKELYGQIVRTQSHNPEFDVFDFLTDLINCSQAYVSMVDFTKKNVFDDESRSILKTMREANASSFFPLIIAIYRKRVDFSKVRSVLVAIETMILRNQVLLGMTANSNERFFAGLALKYSNGESLDSIVLAIQEKAEPDPKVKEAFKEFSPNAGLARQLLFSLFRFNNKGMTIKEPEVHLEHIMPKTKGKWDVEDSIWKVYHKRFGNMIILHKEDNCRIKNELYSKKREAYLDSKIPETRLLGEENDDWTYKQIESRQDLLYDQFIKRWPKV